MHKVGLQPIKWDGNNAKLWVHQQPFQVYTNSAQSLWYLLTFKGIHPHRELAKVVFHRTIFFTGRYLFPSPTYLNHDRMVYQKVRLLWSCLVYLTNVKLFRNKMRLPWYSDHLSRGQKSSTSQKPMKYFHIQLFLNKLLRSESGSRVLMMLAHSSSSGEACLSRTTDIC